MKLILFLLLNFVNGGFDLPGYAQKGRSRNLVPRQSTRKVSKNYRGAILLIWYSISVKNLENNGKKGFWQWFEMQKSKSKQKVTNENDVKSFKLPRSIQKSDNILGNTCKSS